MNLPDRYSPPRPLIEPLEARIAPALLVTGANLLGGGNPTTGEGSIGGHNLTLVKVLSGEAIVWYSGGQINAISVGPNTSLDIYGNVGVIIGNLTAAGKLSDSDNNPSNGLDGDVLLPNNILGITTHPLSNEKGSIGEIITGGSISNLNISGNLIGAYAGTGVFRAQSSATITPGGPAAVDIGVDVNPIQPGVQDTFTFQPGNAKTVESGASIANVTLGGAEELQLFAGNGFAGMPGGSISKVTITNAFIDNGISATTPSYYLYAGDGGNGPKGGAGGSITSVNEANSTGLADIIAGAGGAGSSGPGGAGGSIKGLDMQSVSTAYTVKAGKGGDGAPGGAGGSVTGVNFGGNSISNGIVIAAQFTGGANDDVLLVDSATGTMVLEENLLNVGNTPGFTPVIQDTHTSLSTIASLGTQAVGAVAPVLTSSGLPDIVVAYKGTSTLGVYINQGHGVFYVEDFTNNVYTGDTLEGSSISLPFPPIALAAGHFTGGPDIDLAVAVNSFGNSEIVTLAGTGTGGFTEVTGTVSLPAAPVSIVTAFDNLFVGYKSGEIDALISNLGAAGLPFTDYASVATVSGGVTNLDFDSTDLALLALNGTGNAITVYDAQVNGTLSQTTSISLTQLPGTGLVAHFVPLGTTGEPIQVLLSVGSGSRLDTYTPVSGAYTLTSSVSSTESLTNFAPVIENGAVGDAAVGTELQHFSFSQAEGAFSDIGLPFSSKKVSLSAGDGGDGIDTVTGIAKGGAGGDVYGMSILAGYISIQAGNGGSGENAAGGAGGFLLDTPALVTVTGQSIPTIIEAEYSLLATAGAGGSTTGASHAAIGGAGGMVKGLNLSMAQGDIVVIAGDGGSGNGGAGGAGGMVTALKAVDNQGDLDITAGAGGAADGTIGNGGAGGAIFGVTYSLTLTTPAFESAYNVSLLAGDGGASASAIGGVGGSVGNINLTLQPANESVTNANATPVTSHTNTDSTLRVTITAGNGGNGAVGGAGGSLKSVTATAVYEQLVTIYGLDGQNSTQFYEVNPVAATLTAGNGGNGSKAAGGAGGGVTGLSLAGISHYDPDPADPQADDAPLVIISGNGGNGATTGGVGGAILDVNAFNALIIPTSSSGQPTGTSGDLVDGASELSGALIVSGHGGNGGSGNGGAGGLIAKVSASVQGFGQSSYLSLDPQNVFIGGGQMTIQSGAGGAGGASGKGGAGGAITGLQVGSSDIFEDYGLLFQGGAGGNGGLGGGAGGGVNNIQLNAAQNPETIGGYDAMSTLILAGNGGAATGAGAAGGTGGSISQIVESKDVNTAINLIQAGNGGSAIGAGGLGGSVTNVQTVGLIGQASDDNFNSFGVFQTESDPATFGTMFPFGVPQGVFAGRGGAGATAGLAGSVLSIQAAQIAAIGAAANSSGLFAAAEKVANVTAEVIGYDQNGNGLYDNVSGTNLTAPSQAVPIDGFLFSMTTPTGIVVANPTLLKAFTFVG